MSPMRSGGIITIAACLCCAFPSAQRGAQMSALTVFIAGGSGARGLRAGDRQLASWALDAWRRAAAPGLSFAEASEGDALIRLYWTEPNSGRYGEMQPLIVRGQAGAAVFIQADVSLLGRDIAGRAARDDLFRDSIVYLTCLHELGHALGLAHTAEFRDIMYFFGFGGDIVDYFNRYRSQLHARADIPTISGLSEGDRRRISTLYAAGSPVR
jgi:matrixin